MKFMLLAGVVLLLLVVSLTHGAAIAAVGSPAARSAPSGQNTITAVGEMNFRTGRQEEEPRETTNLVESNEVGPIFRSAPRFPAVFHPSNNFQLNTWGNFAMANSGVIFWSVAGILGLIAAVWVISLFTGMGFFKTVVSGFDTFKGRADEMGFKVDSEKLNVMASQVYKAIETWRAKNAKSL